MSRNLEADGKKGKGALEALRRGYVALDQTSGLRWVYLGSTWGLPCGSSRSISARFLLILADRAWLEPPESHLTEKKEDP